MSGSPEHQTGIEEEMSGFFGPIERRSESYHFSDFSHYYDRELGGQVWKRFLSFSQPVPADELVSAKLTTEELQRKYAVHRDGEFRRTVNLDPGYVTGWNVVLSTVKNHSHRIYLRKGVFGEVTLVYRNGAFHPLPWTYPDYRSTGVLEFFELVRKDWLAQCSDR